MKVAHLLCCAAALAVPAVPAGAVKIDLVDLGGVAGSEAEGAFRIAADYWESILTNDVTVSIGVRYADLGRYTIAELVPTEMDITAADWVDRVTETGSSSTVDQSLVLPTLSNGALSMITNGSSDAAINDAAVQVYRTGGTSLETLWSTTAVVKAIGGDARYDANNPNQLDGEISYNSQVDFDFDPSDGIEEYSIDFIGSAIHEMGHALGFTSGVAITDYYSYPNGENDPEDLNDSWIYSPLDMFRYSRDANDLAPGEGASLDVSIGTEAYFSIDAGKTALYDGYFATGAYHGDGDQAAHWKDTRDACRDERGTMNPTACGGQLQEVTALDLAAFDAIGWNLSIDALENPDYRVDSAEIYRQFAAAVPEPATWATMLLGFAFIGGALRQRPTRLRNAIGSLA